MGYTKAYYYSKNLNGELVSYFQKYQKSGEEE
jgi:hypothetical protein